MAARKPTRSVEVRGRDFSVNDEFVRSWAALKMYMKFSDDELPIADKLALSFELIERATGCGEDAVVEMAGGEMAPADDVIALAAELISAINPKN